MKRLKWNKENNFVCITEEKFKSLDYLIIENIDNFNWDEFFKYYNFYKNNKLRIIKKSKLKI